MIQSFAQSRAQLDEVMRQHADARQVLGCAMTITTDIPSGNMETSQVLPASMFETGSLGDETARRLASADGFEAVDNRGRDGATDADEQQAGSGGIGTHRELTLSLWRGVRATAVYSAVAAGFSPNCGGAMSSSVRLNSSRTDEPISGIRKMFGYQTYWFSAAGSAPVTKWFAGLK